MGTITLDDRDEALLRALQDATQVPEALADHVGADSGYVQDRLIDLADNGLVESVENGGYRLLANGQRVLASSPSGTQDNPIDTPDDVEERIQSFDLRPDRAAAVHNVFAYLHYWGSATERDIVDAVYSETSAGFESVDEWWDDCVGTHLRALPRVDAPASSDESWRYTGTPTVEQATDDGRTAPEQSTDDQA